MLFLGYRAKGPAETRHHLETYSVIDVGTLDDFAAVNAVKAEDVAGSSSRSTARQTFSRFSGLPLVLLRGNTTPCSTGQTAQVRDSLRA